MSGSRARHPDREGGHLRGRRAEEDQRPPARRPQRAVARGAAARHQRHPRHAGFPGARARHGRHRQRRARKRQQRDDRRREHQQRSVGRDGHHRAQRRCGPGIPGDRQQPVGRVRPERRGHGQRDHQGRARTRSAAACTSSTGTRTCARGAIFDNRAIPSPISTATTSAAASAGRSGANNTFFFVSAEVVRELTGTTSNSTVETQQLVNWVNANRPNSIAAQLFRRHAPPSYPTTDLRDLGGPLPGANVWSTTPDGIPDVGTISVVNNGPRDGDQLNARVDQVFRGGRDRLRATYYLANVESQFLYVRPQFNHPYPFRNQVINVGAHLDAVGDDAERGDLRPGAAARGGGRSDARDAQRRLPAAASPGSASSSGIRSTSPRTTSRSRTR